MKFLPLVAVASFVTLFAMTLLAQATVLFRLKKYHRNNPNVVGIGFNPIIGSWSQIAALFKFLWRARYKDLNDRALAIECNVLRFCYVLYLCSMILIILTTR